MVAQAHSSIIAGVVHLAGYGDVLEAINVGALVDNPGPSSFGVELGLRKRLVDGCSDCNLVRSEDTPVAVGLGHF